MGPVPRRLGDTKWNYCLFHRKILKVFGPRLYQNRQKNCGEIFCCRSSSSQETHETKINEQTWKIPPPPPPCHIFTSMELFHGGKIGCSETSKRQELAHFPNDLLEACQLGLSQNEETIPTISAGLLLFQHLSWQVLGLRPITKSRKVWIAIPSIKSNTFKDRPCPNVQQASANQSPFFKGLGFLPTKQRFPATKKNSVGWSFGSMKTSTENQVPKKCLSKPWIFFWEILCPPKIVSQTAEPHLKKSSMAWKKKQWNWKEKPMQIPIISSLKIANWFPGDLKSPEFDVRKRGKQQGCLAFFRVGHLCIDNLFFTKYPQTMFEMFTQPYRLGADSIGVLNTFRLEHGRY